MQYFKITTLILWSFVCAMIPDTVVGLPWSGSVAGVGLSIRLLGTVPVPTPVVRTGTWAL